MYLEELADYIVETDSLGVNYYKASEVAQILGFQNTSQTLKMYCKYTQAKIADVIQVNGSVRKVKFFIIPEADVQILIDRAKERDSEVIDFNLRNANLTIKQLDEEIVNLEAFLHEQRQEASQALQEQYYKEAAKLDILHKSYKKNLEVEKEAELAHLLAIEKSKIEFKLNKLYKKQIESAETKHLLQKQLLDTKHKKDIDFIDNQSHLSKKLIRLKARKRSLLLKSGFKPVGENDE